MWPFLQKCHKCGASWDSRYYTHTCGLRELFMEVGRQMIDPVQLKAVAKVLKKRFGNLTVEQTIDIASEILSVIKDVKEY